MKIILTAAVASLSCFGVSNAVTHNADIYYGQKRQLEGSMWLFSKDGVSIYDPSGEVIHIHDKNQVCPNKSTSYRPPYITTQTCSYFDVASDGHQYVWAANFDDSPNKVDIFDINTGDYVGYTPTCSTPLDLNYHPMRREMWVRCAGNTTDAPGHMDVFSTNSIGTNHEMIQFETDSQRNYGRMETHSAMGNVGFATTYNQPFLRKYDLSGKDVIGKYTIPGGAGSYESTYSHVNKHIFISVRSCCSCGTNFTDIVSCGYSGPKMMMIVNGPSASDQMQNGTCSNSCKGSAADTIGVTEFDTVGNVFVGNHNSLANNGCVPKGSPDGKTVVLLPYDGGATVRVLRTGENGEASTVAADIAVGFEGGTPKKSSVSDLAWVQDGVRNFMVISSNNDNNLVIVDMDDGYRMVKIPLSMNVESTAAGNRQVEWAIGTDYVWVNGEESEEMYIVKLGQSIEDTEVITTLVGVSTKFLVFIKNYERQARMSEMTAMMKAVAQSYLPPKGPATIRVDISLDEYPAETSWTLTNTCNDGNTVVASGGPYAAALKNTATSEEFIVGDGTFVFEIRDSYGDGICCASGEGDFSVYRNDVEVVAMIPRNNYFANDVKTRESQFGEARDCTSCSTDPVTIEITLDFGNFPGDLSWELFNTCNGNVSVDSGAGTSDNFSQTYTVEDGTYELHVNDSYGDGMTEGSFSASFKGAVSVGDPVFEKGPSVVSFGGATCCAPM